MKFLHFFLFLWDIFAPLDPDPTKTNADPRGPGSGSTTRNTDALFISDPVPDRQKLPNFFFIVGPQPNFNLFTDF
jgi:hypothetical protein